MKIIYVKSACVIVEHEGIRVLCDPWLTDGIYYGSWYHFPPLSVQPEDFSDIDYIYISHIHPDHLDIATLKRLPKNIPILIHNFADKFVLNLLKKIGMENITEISHKEVFSLSKDFTIEILAADNCNPEICGRYFNCNISQPYSKTQQIDTLAVFQGGNKVVVNCNDCPYAISKTVCDDILEKHDAVDFLLVGYRGAGPYPQCFDNLDEAKKDKEALVHRDAMLKQSMQFIQHLRPDIFLPFAGQYTLGGKLAKLNRYLLPQMEDLPEIFSHLLKEYKLDSQLILLNSMQFYDLEKKACSTPFIVPPPEERQRYIDEVLSLKKLDYESDETADPSKQFDLEPKLTVALERMQAHQKHFGNFSSNWNIYLDVGFDYVYQIPFNFEKKIQKINKKDMVAPFLRIGVDYPLMLRILERKAHWNNAEIGSHLRYYREPNEFQRTVHFMLSYLQC